MAHRRIGASVRRRIGALAHRRTGASAHRRIGAPAHRRIGAPVRHRGLVSLKARCAFFSSSRSVYHVAQQQPSRERR